MLLSYIEYAHIILILMRLSSARSPASHTVYYDLTFFYFYTWFTNQIFLLRLYVAFHIFFKPPVWSKIIAIPPKLN
uniref:Uncharacterized protein n=1 Tax=Anopheles darlingi TaxID=43151 RepID=A0A2M4D2V0_ANODA